MHTSASSVTRAQANIINMIEEQQSSLASCGENYLFSGEKRKVKAIMVYTQLKYNMFSS